MLSVLDQGALNPHADQHAYGNAAARQLKADRATIAASVGCTAAEVILTSGASEANNLGLKGIALAARVRGRRRILIGATEHSCVRNSADWLAGQGFVVETLPVTREGVLDLGALEAAIGPDVALVATMAVNNETGVCHPLADIAGISARHGVAVHCDAAQAPGRIPLPWTKTHPTSLSLSAHKIGGPVGVGALIVRRDPPVLMEPLIHGGGQERGLRAGTVPVALVAGFAAALQESVLKTGARAQQASLLENRLIRSLGGAGIAFTHNGATADRAAGILSLTLDRPAEDVMDACPNLALATGAACQSNSGRPSHTLLAMGLSATQADRTIRVSFGPETTAADIDHAVTGLVQACSPPKSGGSGQRPVQPIGE